MDLDQAALLGLTTLRDQLNAQIEELDAKLKGKETAIVATPNWTVRRRFVSATDLDGEEPEPKERRKSVISADGRARIAAAKRAWHAAKKAAKDAEKATADAKEPAKAIRTARKKRKRGRPRKKAVAREVAA